LIERKDARYITRMTIDAVLRRIRAYRQSQGLSRRAFAHCAGLQESSIRLMDDDEWSPSVRTLRRLEAVIPEGFQERRGAA